MNHRATSKLFLLLLIAASLLTLLGAGQAWAASYFGVFDAEGTFIRGKGVTANFHVATGSYSVVFRANVSKCAYTATLGGENLFGVAFISALRGADLRTVNIEAVDATGLHTVDTPFTLLVTC